MKVSQKPLGRLGSWPGGMNVSGTAVVITCFAMGDRGTDWVSGRPGPANKLTLKPVLISVCRGGEKSGIDQPENRARTFPLCALFAFATPAASAQSPAMLSRCARLGAPVAEALSAAPSRAPVLTVLQRARAPTAGLARPGAAICMVKLAIFSSYPRACGV